MHTVLVRGDGSVLIDLIATPVAGGIVVPGFGHRRNAADGGAVEVEVSLCSTRDLAQTVIPEVLVKPLRLHPTTPCPPRVAAGDIKEAGVRCAH